jgi:hypothetical protein
MNPDYRHLKVQPILPKVPVIVFRNIKKSVVFASVQIALNLPALTEKCGQLIIQALPEMPLFTILGRHFLKMPKNLFADTFLKMQRNLFATTFSEMPSKLSAGIFRGCL